MVTDADNPEQQPHASMRLPWGAALAVLGMGAALCGVYADSRAQIAVQAERISGVERSQDKIDGKLDRILDKLDQKADRPRDR